MCWVISTGARSIIDPRPPIKALTACGPPVDEPISSTRGAVSENGRNFGGSASPACGDTSGTRLGVSSILRARTGAGRGCLHRQARRGRGGTRPAELARTQCADLVDQFAPERQRGGELATGLRLRNVVDRPERQRAQADLGVAARQRRSHQHDEIALFLQQSRQRRDAVDIRHIDVEDGDVGLHQLDLLDRLAPAAQRSNDLQIRLGLEPARDHAADDDGVVDHHHADRIVRARGAQSRRGGDDTHCGRRTL